VKIRRNAGICLGHLSAMASPSEKCELRFYFNCNSILWPSIVLADSSHSIAGSDTSAQAIRSTILYIVTNAQVQAKLLKELSTAKISNPIKDSEARELPYLQAVIKESLRIFPPVTGLFLKEVPPGGDTLNGIFVPEKTTIGSSSFGVMRNPKVWGKDAALFRPERWLEGSKEEIQQMDYNVELVFGYGKYQCLGKNVARMELNKIFVEVRFLQHLDEGLLRWVS
jgi:cytochrome P450